ncbi:DNA-binding protein [Paracoccus sp. Z330]|uniref:DNA-binding protein n=1 Tax=Paracoccus onchidii TaxID=3017813 RepID=A0ABT4ZDW5_9RHOB|nr:DNA-binding protein [Paracoccus onchidii]MDB6177477.1 DNA-binding protein [Paracoccus onchidii]
MKKQPVKNNVGRRSNGLASSDPQPAQVIHKRDFVDRVVAATGAKKSEARPIIEATLEQLGEALSAGYTLAVPPLGRGRVNLEKDQRGGDVITLRLRRRGGTASA